MTDGLPYAYEGSELDLFTEAVNWRRYWASRIRPYLGQSVLEVGAGIGSVTRVLRKAGQPWTALEPDPELARRVNPDADVALTVIVGTLADLAGNALFDSIVYIDVLEHIEDDRREVQLAFNNLASGGRLIILSPAHQWLFTPFDDAIGHFRRYSLKSLRALRPAGAVEVHAEYLDSAGMLASGANRVLLRSASPSRSQIQLWDRRLVPVSRRLDRLLGGRLGKSVLVVWKKG